MSERGMLKTRLDYVWKYLSESPDYEHYLKDTIKVMSNKKEVTTTQAVVDISKKMDSENVDPCFVKRQIIWQYADYVFKGGPKPVVTDQHLTKSGKRAKVEDSPGSDADSEQEQPPRVTASAVPAKSAQDRKQVAPVEISLNFGIYALVTSAIELANIDKSPGAKERLAKLEELQSQYMAIVSKVGQKDPTPAPIEAEVSDPVNDEEPAHSEQATVPTPA